PAWRSAASISARGTPRSSATLTKSPSSSGVLAIERESLSNGIVPFGRAVNRLQRPGLQRVRHRPLNHALIPRHIVPITHFVADVAIHADERESKHLVQS